MSTQLIESNLYVAITAEQLSDIRSKAPAGEDPVSDAILNACAVVDSFVLGREVPARLLTKMAVDVCIFDLVKLLGKASDDQKAAYEAALKMLEGIKEGKFGFPYQQNPGQLGWGSRKKI